MILLHGAVAPRVQWLGETSDRQLHGDQLGHRVPPVNLTHGQRWAATKLSRPLGQTSIFLLRLGTCGALSLPGPAHRSNAERRMDVDSSCAGRVGGVSGPEDSYRKRFLLSALREGVIQSDLLEGAATTRLAAGRRRG